MLTGIAQARVLVFTLTLFSFKSMLTGATECRLVEGSSLNKLLVDMNLSHATHASLCQHEQQVMEIAAQLMQVCRLRWIIYHVWSSVPDPANVFCADSYMWGAGLHI